MTPCKCGVLVGEAPCRACLLAEIDHMRKWVQLLDEKLMIVDRRLWSLVRNIHEAIRRRSWLLDGRGCYEWDDNRYRLEAAYAFEDVDEAIKKALSGSDMQYELFKKASQKLKDEARVCRPRQGRLAKIVAALAD